MTTDPTIKTACSTHMLVARGQYRETTTWYASGLAEVSRMERILRTDMGMGARRVTVKAV